MVDLFLTAIGSNAIIATVIGFVAWLGSRCYQRPSLWHAVWVIALVKLFLPPIWSIPMGFVSDQAVAVTQRIVDRPNASVQPLSSIPASSAPTSGPPADPKTSATTRKLEENRWSVANFSLSLVAVSVWGFGAMIALVASSYRIADFNALVRQGMPADVATDLLVASMATSHFTTLALPRVRMVDHVVPPLLWPVGRKATIVIPATLWHTMNEGERRAVLMHELVHWRRCDHWIRLLQWLACIVYWWHPLMRIACSELHRLEEQCCDAEVLHRLPNAGRSYASALVSASQWLGCADETRPAELSLSTLAIPMSDPNQFHSFHRRIQMLPTLKYRPWTRPGIFVLLLATVLPLILGLGVSGQQTVTPESEAATGDARSAILTGQLTDKAGKPLANAKVRVVIPATDLRLLLDTSGYREVWGQSDVNGKYSIDIADIKKETDAAIDILHPGHRRIEGAVMGGDGEPNVVTLTPGEQVTFDASLPKRLYFAGQVVDEAGKPIQGVLVGSSLRTNTASFAVERSMTDAEGRFAVYCYDAKYFDGTPEWKDSSAEMMFFHDQYILARVEKIEGLDASKRDSIKVVLKKGFSLAGKVVNPDNSPAKAVAITILQRPYQRKGVMTDENGDFRCDGLQGTTTQIRLVDVLGNCKSIQSFDLEASDTDMTVLLEPFESPITKTYQMLGMTMVDVTEAINSAYDLQLEQSDGVMILDPGKQFRRFGIGELKPGNVLGTVGMESVDNLRSFVRQLIKESKSPTIPPWPGVNPSAYPGENGNMHVRVVYGYHDENGKGSNTQYMILTPQDVAELEALLETL